MRALRAAAGEGDDSYGIIVGSGDTPPSNSDYALESKISHGDGDNLLHYGPVTVSDIYVTDSEVYFEITRDFTNNGSVDVTVKEIGLVVYQTILYRTNTSDHVNVDFKALIIRDVLDTPRTISPGSTLSVTYRISVALPFLKNMALWLRGLMAGTTVTLKNQGGGDTNLQLDRGAYREGISWSRGAVLMLMNFKAGSEDDNGGIIVGSSDTAPTLDDYCLGSKITKDQVYYGSSNPVELASEVDKWVLRFRRTIRNDGTSPVTVKEIGFKFRYRCYVYYYTAGMSLADCDEDRRLLVFREVKGPYTLNPGDLITVTGEIEIPK